MDEKLPTLELSLEEAPPHEVFDLWRESILPLFDSVPVDNRRITPKCAAHTQHIFDRFILAESKFPKQEFVRDRKWMMRNDDADHVIVQIFTKGNNPITNGKHQFVQGPETISFVNLGYELHTIAEESEVTSLVLPRDLLAQETKRLDLATGVALMANSAAGRIFRDHVFSLRDNISEMTVAEAPAITDSLLGMMDALFVSHDIESEHALEATLHSMCKLIEESLKDPKLSAETLCARFNCSRTTVYRLFKTHGGISRYIQERRLQKCYRALSQQRNHSRGVFGVALEYGFTNQSHFSRIFKASFGISPKEVLDFGTAGRQNAARSVAIGASGNFLEKARRIKSSLEAL